MNHVFICALPTSQEKDARASEIAAIRVHGFGPYTRKSVEKAFRVSLEGSKTLLADLYKEIVTVNPFVLVTDSEITRSLVRIENERCKLNDAFTGRAWLDIGQLAWPFVATGQIQTRTLVGLAKHFGVKWNTASNDSADKCTALMQVYGHMMRRYSTALKGEGFLREAGGESLEEFRKIIGF